MVRSHSSILPTTADMFVSAEQSGSTVRRNTGERMGLDQGYFDAGLRRMVSEHIGERQRLLFCVIGAYAMAESKTTQWHPTAAYLYVLHLDGPALAWEYLRRNPDYRRDWLGRCADPRTAAGRWGLRLLEDPNRDARDALPDWARPILIVWCTSELWAIPAEMPVPSVCGECRGTNPSPTMDTAWSSPASSLAESSA
jgi:hypothetical protein